MQRVPSRLSFCVRPQPCFDSGCSLLCRPMVVCVRVPGQRCWSRSARLNRVFKAVGPTGSLRTASYSQAQSKAKQGKAVGQLTVRRPSETVPTNLSVDTPREAILSPMPYFLSSKISLLFASENGEDHTGCLMIWASFRFCCQVTTAQAQEGSVDST